jgi:AcrR family transcriptional regulator
MGRTALSNAEKRAKKQEIVEVAARLFHGTPYPSITMASIAREAGVAKGTLYLYFRTKEELFLALLLDRLQGWFAEYAPVLQSLAGPLHPRDLAALLAKAATTRPDLIRLIALLHAVLERNISMEQARDFKRQLLAFSMGMGGALERVFPVFQPGDGLHFCLYYYSIVVGLYQMSSPAPEVVEALDTPELRPMLIDFESHLAGILTGLLGGWWVGAAPHLPDTRFLHGLEDDLTGSD